MFITKTEILIRYRTEPKRKPIRFSRCVRSGTSVANNQLVTFFFMLSYHLFSTTGSQLPLTSDDGTSDQKIVLKLFDRAFESAE